MRHFFVKEYHLFIYKKKRNKKTERNMPTFHPKFSKNVHSRACPVVLPPQGPETQK